MSDDRSPAERIMSDKELEFIRDERMKHLMANNQAGDTKALIDMAFRDIPPLIRSHKAATNRATAAEAEVEQQRVQMAGISVAALGGTKDPAKQGDYGWSVPYQDVLNLRLRFNDLEADVERLKADIQGFLHTLASFALEDEDLDVRVALGKERAKLQSLTGDLQVAVEALRKEWVNDYRPILTHASEKFTESRIADFCREFNIPRSFFDRHIAPKEAT